MKKIIIILNLIVVVMLAAAAPIFPQANIFRVAPGAEAQLSSLLNKPAMVSDATATPLGRNWFTLETDAHVFTDQVSLRQVAAVLLDIENQPRYFDGKRSKLLTSVISRKENEVLADFVSIAMVPVINIQLKTPYRATVKTISSTASSFSMDIRQLPENSATNGDIKNLTAPRYLEEVTINGKKYTYIRVYSKMDINASILPGAKGTLEKNSAPTNEEALEMIITAAKTK
jgi:hypothetical protein